MATGQPARLDGVALVTGAGRSARAHGVGSAISVVLARTGLQVAVVDVDAEAARRTVSEIDASGGRAFPVIADLGTAEGCRSAAAETLTTGGRIDVLVNNVAIVQPGTATEITDEQWQRVLAVNLTAAFRLSRAAVTQMRAQGGGGSIINITSIAGLRGGGHTVAYAASKAGLIGLTQDMAGSHGDDGIRVNAIAPGYLYTPMVEEFSGMEEMRERRRRLGALNTEGTCWDVAGLVAFLAGEDAKWITGTVIPVDAGAQALQPLAIATRFGLLGAQRLKEG